MRSNPGRIACRLEIQYNALGMLCNFTRKCLIEDGKMPHSMPLLCLFFSRGQEEIPAFDPVDPAEAVDQVGARDLHAITGEIRETGIDRRFLVAGEKAGFEAFVALAFHAAEQC